MSDGIKAAPALAEKLAKLGLVRADDLVLHLPLRYEDETRCFTVAEAPWGEPVQVEARVVDVSVQFRPRRQLVARVRDAAGDELTLRFLNFYGSQTKQLEGARDNARPLRLFGEVRSGFLGPEMVHPRYRVVDAEAPLPDALTPVYPTTAGVSQTALRKLIGVALAEADLGELFPACDAGWLAHHGMAGFADAVHYLHHPPPGAPLAALQSRDHPAWRRIKFDEALAQQLSLRRAFLARRERGAPRLLASGELGR
ncbi:MAG TPA: ATP-dependent DNA helicase RecG, partial [Azospira sp.]|nr:ATP-dependent DNA helicase RecG [Azospira sp.]